jgi:hypothetical protein
VQGVALGRGIAPMHTGDVCCSLSPNLVRP